MGRSSRPITVTLGDLQKSVDSRLKSGGYASASEVVRAALRALEREEACLNNWLRQSVEESLADPRPNIPAGQVFRSLRRYHARQSQGRGK